MPCSLVVNYQTIITDYTALPITINNLQRAYYQVDRKLTYHVTLRHVCSHRCRGKGRGIKHSEGVCILASFLRRIVLSFVASLSVSYFATLSPKPQDFQGKVIE
jgi:hypothetical protein